MKGLFITLEGCDGLGKSRQSAALVAYLREIGHSVFFTKEPGTAEAGSRLGPMVRQILFEKKGEAAPGTDQLFLLADHVDNGALLTPHLEQGETVVCDRYADSALAYAAVHKQPTTPEMLSLWLRNRGPLPDVTILLVAKGKTSSSDIGWSLDRARRRTGSEAVKQGGKHWNDYAAQLLVQRAYLTLLAGETRTVIVPIGEADTEQVVHERIIAQLGLHPSFAAALISGRTDINSMYTAAC
jgi:dTMP kinase